MSEGAWLPESAAVIGLGLIGGSLARDLLARGVTVRGYDRSAVTLGATAELGLQPLDGCDGEAVGDVDLVVLAIPVTDALAMLPALAKGLSARTVVTDLGSTKASIVREASDAGIGERFLGSHPLAGDHRSGWEAAREGLFSGARVFVCATEETSDSTRACIVGLWRGLGALPEEIDATSHDHQVAWTSHLPQIASSALAVTLASAGFPAERLGPGGRDATRLAASSPDMWTSICADNAEQAGAALAALELRIAEFREAIERGDRVTIRRLFTVGRGWSRIDPS